MLKWAIGLGIVWYFYRQGQGSVAAGVQGALQNTPVGPALDTIGATLDGAARYVTTANGIPAPLNTGPTGPYGTLGPGGTGIFTPNTGTSPRSNLIVVGTFSGDLKVDKQNPSVMEF